VPLHRESASTTAASSSALKIDGRRLRSEQTRLAIIEAFGVASPNEGGRARQAGLSGALRCGYHAIDSARRITGWKSGSCN
jgi:hypothetical protein